LENTDLASIPVSFLDCQTTGPAPGKGHLLEMAWSVLPSRFSCPEIHSFLVKLPCGEVVPRRISGMTGITAEMSEKGLLLSELARLILPVLENTHPVAHFAVFEQRWIDSLFSEFLPDADIPRIICTREIARRLYPQLPRKGIRALSGYLGFSMGEKKRAANHVRATEMIWRKLIPELKGKKVFTISQLNEFLDSSPPGRSGSWEYPLPRETRLSLPDVPGVYRFLSSDGSVLYTGKASSLKKRVNSYFTKRKADGKTLELVSQVHDVTCEERETPLEAALLEFDTIRRFDPPYNIALRERVYEILFLSDDLSSCSLKPEDRFPWGPVPEGSPSLLLHELLRAMNDRCTMSAGRLGLDFLPLDNGALESGFSLFRDSLHNRSWISMSNFLRAGLGLWLGRADEKHQESDEERDEHEQPETLDADSVKKHLEWLLAAGARDLRRGAWFCQLGWSSILWKPVSSETGRFALFKDGVLHSAGWQAAGIRFSPEPVSRMERQLRFDARLYDLLRVLDSEVRRIVSDGCLKNIHLPSGVSLDIGKIGSLYRII
jgi:DNA polymerase III subunit epsilon